MKKILYLIVLFIILTPVIIFADGASPVIIEYDAIVINKNGAKVLDSKEIIKYNSKVRVYDERYENGKLCASVCYINEKECGAWSRYILLSDIVPLKEEITLKDIKNSADKETGESPFSKTNSTIIIFEKDGIKLSKGPAKAYGTYDEVVDYMTTFNSKYVTYGGGGDGTASSDWYYVDDGKHHGWVNDSSDANYSVGIMLKGNILTFSKVEFQNEDNKKITIPAETILNEVYYISNGGNYFIKYKYDQGFINDFSYGFDLGYNGLTVRNTKITSIDGKTRIDVPFGEKVTILYANDYDEPGLTPVNDMYYVQYKNSKGFIKYNTLIPTYEENVKTNNITLDYDAIMYDYSVENSIYPDTKKVIETIPKGENITTYYEFEEYVYGENGSDGYYIYWYLVDYKGKMGIIEMKREETSEEKNNNQPAPIPSNNKNNHHKKPSDIIIYAIVGSIIVSATIAATIIIINSNKKLKKEKQKKNENIKHEKDEVKKEEEKEIKKDKVATSNNEKEIKNDIKEKKEEHLKTKNEIIKENNEEIVPKKNKKKIKK